KTAHAFEQYNFHATFYLVTGWVRPTRVYVRDPWNKNRDHGRWADWRMLHANGHEIGSHTFSHINASGKLARFVPGLMRREITRSYYDLRARLEMQPVSLSMPWNAAGPSLEKIARKLYQAVRLGSSVISFNDLGNVSWYQLTFPRSLKLMTELPRRTAWYNLRAIFSNEGPAAFQGIDSETGCISSRARKS